MADLTLRLTKGSALTLQELDSNFQALDSDVANLSSSLSSSYVTLATTQSISGAKTFSNTLTASNGAVFNGLTYPTTDGNVNQFMTTNGSGVLSFATVESYDSVKVQQQIDSDFTNTKTTANLSELTNLYFTNARADARIAAASIFDLSNVTSGTVVTNLNADKVDGFNGIGIYDSAGTLLNG